MPLLICGKYFASEGKSPKIRLVITGNFGYTCKVSVKNMSLHYTIRVKKYAQLCTILCLNTTC
jgi:hypothetical protein